MNFVEDKPLQAQLEAWTTALEECAFKQDTQTQETIYVIQLPPGCDDHRTTSTEAAEQLCKSESLHREPAPERVTQDLKVSTGC